MEISSLLECLITEIKWCDSWLIAVSCFMRTHNSPRWWVHDSCAVDKYVFKNPNYFVLVKSLLDAFDSIRNVPRKNGAEIQWNRIILETLELNSVLLRCSSIIINYNRTHCTTSRSGTLSFITCKCTHCQHTLSAQGSYVAALDNRCGAVSMTFRFIVLQKIFDAAFAGFSSVIQSLCYSIGLCTHTHIRSSHLALWKQRIWNWRRNRFAEKIHFLRYRAAQATVYIILLNELRSMRTFRTDTVHVIHFVTHTTSHEHTSAYKYCAAIDAAFFTTFNPFIALKTLFHP